MHMSVWAAHLFILHWLKTDSFNKTILKLNYIFLLFNKEALHLAKSGCKVIYNITKDFYFNINAVF